MYLHINRLEFELFRDGRIDRRAVSVDTASLIPLPLAFLSIGSLPLVTLCTILLPFNINLLGVFYLNSHTFSTIFIDTFSLFGIDTIIDLGIQFLIRVVLIELDDDACHVVASCSVARCVRCQAKVEQL